jgi:hypothetical protein
MALQSLSQASYVKLIGGARPMIIGTRLRATSVAASIRSNQDLRLLHSKPL